MTTGGALEASSHAKSPEPAPHSTPQHRSVHSAPAPPRATNYPTTSVSCIEPLDVESTKALEETFRNLQPYFEGRESEQNWSHRDTSLLKLRRITRGNAPNAFTTTYLAGIKALLDGILKTANSLRTTLSTTGCHLIQDIAVAAGPGLENMVEILLQSLIKLCAATKKISSQNGNTTVNTIFANVSFTPRLVQHIWNAAQDKNVQPRTFAAGWLKTIINIHGHHKHVLEHGGSLEIMEKTIRVGLNDANPGVRGSMRSAFWAFASISTEKSESIMLALDAKQLSQLVDDPSNPNPGKTIVSMFTATKKAREVLQGTKSVQPTLRDTMTAKKREQQVIGKLPKCLPVEQTSLPTKTTTLRLATAVPTVSRGTGLKAACGKATCTKATSTEATGTMSSAPVRPSRSGPKATKADLTKKGPEAGSTLDISAGPLTKKSTTLARPSSSVSKSNKLVKKTSSRMSSSDSNKTSNGPTGSSSENDADVIKKGPKTGFSLTIPAAGLTKKANALARPTGSISGKAASKIPSTMSSSHSHKTSNVSTGGSSEKDASTKNLNALAPPTRSVSNELVSETPARMSLSHSKSFCNGPTGSSSENDAELTYQPSVHEVPRQLIPPVDLDQVDILPSETHPELRTPMASPGALWGSPRIPWDWKVNIAFSHLLGTSPRTRQAHEDHINADEQITSPMRSLYPTMLHEMHANAPGFDSPAKQLGWRQYEADERFHSLWVSDAPNPLAGPVLQTLISQLEARGLGLRGFRDLQDIIRNYRAVCGLPTTFRRIAVPLVDWLMMTDNERISSAIVLTLRMLADYHRSALVPYHVSIMRSVLTARKHYASTQFVIYGISELTEQIVEACDPETLLGEVVSMLQAISDPEYADTIVMGLSVAAKLVHRLKQITSQSIIERTGSYAASCVSDDKCTEVRESGIKLATELSVWVTEEAFWKIFAGIHGGTKGLLEYYVEKLKRELQED